MIKVPKRDGYVRKLVARRLVEHHDADGWAAVSGKGPDGKYWVGDSLVMEIPEAKYAELQSRNRATYETARKVMEAGGPAQDAVPEDGVTIRTTKPVRERLTVPVG